MYRRRVGVVVMLVIACVDARRKKGYCQRDVQNDPPNATAPAPSARTTKAQPPARVALISVGQPRHVLTRPLVVSRFRDMRRSLGGAVDLFMLVVDDGTPIDLRNVKELYAATAVRRASAAYQKSCGPHTATGHDEPRRFATQASHFRRPAARIIRRVAAPLSAATQLCRHSLIL